MAVRSGAGTGVIVSLVIFIVLTIFGLVMTIVFYSGQVKAQEAESSATKALTQYVSAQEQGSDRFRTFEQEATANRHTVAGHLAAQYDALSTWVVAGEARSLDELKADLARAGVGESDTVRDVVFRIQRDLRSRQGEIESLNSRLSDRDAELADRDATIARMKTDHRTEIQKVSQEIIAYRDAAEEYGRDVDSTIAKMESSIDELQDDYEDRIDRLERELDSERQQIVLSRARLDEYEAILNEIRVKAKNPALLVDANVLDVEASTNQVYIDRGRDHRIVLGMTFEIYDNPSAIVPDRRTGMMPRGKASVQVTKVGPRSSTCKVTRSVPGRPIVKNNVLANAVYDPDRRFKFLVHGKFDIDQDGRPTEQEAEHLRSLVIDWGGEVIEGNSLPGDLDFLVLGVQPPLPRPLRQNPSEGQINVWARQREAHDLYEQLYQRAADAQIPILNHNRFFILIGHTSN